MAPHVLYCCWMSGRSVNFEIQTAGDSKMIKKMHDVQHEPALQHPLDAQPDYDRGPVVDLSMDL